MPPLNPFSVVNDEGAHWCSKVSTSALPDRILQGVALLSELSVFIPSTNCCIWCGYKGGRLGSVLATIPLVSRNTGVAMVRTCSYFGMSQRFPLWKTIHEVRSLIMPIRPVTSETVLSETSRDEVSLDSASPPYESFMDLTTSTTTAHRSFFKSPLESRSCAY